MVGMVPMHIGDTYMRYITLTILLACATTAHAQTAAEYLVANGVGNLAGAAGFGNLYPSEVVPVAPPFGPAIPIPQGRYAGPWGTGYSVVTTERESTDWLRKSLGDPNHTYKRTVTSILPNDALGQPMQGPSLNFLP
jgi:hypothetical protein